MNGAEGKAGEARIAMLDGWRAVSILSVMAGHMLPLGPASWQLNAASAAGGMAIFFTLSGFLITQQLLRDDRVGAFLIRRLFRILPLAWTAMAIIALVTRPDTMTVAANLFFFANLPPAHLMKGGEVLWSLCVEAQFYLLIAAMVALAGRRALHALPVLALAVTAARIWAGEPMSIVTWHRLDEILAGAILALLMARWGDAPVLARLPRWTPLALALLLLASASPFFPALNYARPYLSAAMVGTSLHAAPGWMRRLWSGRAARYVAEISYALYVVHGALLDTWLGGAGVSTGQRYLRRPLLIAACFLLAHLSTFHYERHWIAMGRRLIRGVYGKRVSAEA